MTAFFQNRIRLILAALIASNFVIVALYFVTGRGFWIMPIAMFLLLFPVLFLVKAGQARPQMTLVSILLGCLIMGLFLTGGHMPRGAEEVSIPFVSGAILLGLGAIGIFLGIVEFGLLPIIGTFRLGAIARITYYEALLQPFTIIVLFTGIIVIGVIARLPFFTYDEDFKMYRDVAASFVFLFTLPVMIFASTKVVDEEIENRTMLTLMSKPVARWQVILGKYLGVLLLIMVSVVSLGTIAGICQYLRYYDDQTMDYRLTAPTMGDATGKLITDAQGVAVPNPEYVILEMKNTKATYALLPGLALTLMQLATLAALSVAVSTRYGLAANVTAVVLIYIAASMAQYFRTTEDLPAPFGFLATAFSYLLPGLGLLDLNQRLVFGQYIYGKNDVTLVGPALDLPTYRQVWQYVGIAAVYSLFYIGAALSMGMALFRTRELS